MAEQQKAATIHHWDYLKANFFGEDQVTVSEPELIVLIKQGAIQTATKVCSLTRTKGQWTTAGSIPGLLKLIDAANQEREAQRVEIAKANAQAKVELARINAQARGAAANAKPGVPDESNATASIRSKVEGILTQGETIDLICIQANPVAIYKDAVVCTSKRLILFHPKMLGRFEFEDFLWMDLSDAHLKQEIISSTFSARHVSGRVISMGWLTKDGARNIYRHAQKMEEQAFFKRREMAMEEKAAGATKISIGQPAADSPTVPKPESDTTAKLKKLKEMLELELISQDEFNAKKQRLLDEL